MRVALVLAMLLSTTAAHAQETPVFRTQLPAPILFLEGGSAGAPDVDDNSPEEITLTLGDAAFEEARIGRPWSFGMSTVTASSAGDLVGVSWATDTAAEMQSLPGTVSMSGSDGVLSGVPSAQGSYSFDVVALHDAVENTRRTYTIVVGGDSLEVVSLTTGHEHSCAIVTNGEVWCWGNNQHGQIGVSTETSRSPVPVKVEGVNGAVDVSAGWRHTCALLATGEVSCWGQNSYRQLGASGSSSAVPVAVPGISGASKIKAAGEMTCVIASNEVWCWGSNSFGQLGRGGTSPSAGPGKAGSLSNASEIAVGPTSVCARLSNAQVWCWGASTNGRFGPGISGNVLSPTRTTAVEGLSGLVAGDMHYCGLYGSTVRCIGDSQSGQSGTNSFTTSGAQISISLPASATKVFAGSAGTCALASNGKTYCWGNNYYGQFGNAASSSKVVTPVTVAALDGATDISLSNNHACYRMSTGVMKCAGYGGLGALGHGANTNKNTPTDVVRP